MYQQCITKRDQFEFLEVLSSLKMRNATKAAALVMLYKSTKMRSVMVDGVRVKFHEYGHEFSVAKSLYSTLFGKISNDLLELCITVAFLHDIREDCAEITEWFITHQFGNYTSNLVSVLSSSFADTIMVNQNYAVTKITMNLVTLLVKSYDRIETLNSIYGIWDQKRTIAYMEKNVEFLESAKAAFIEAETRYTFIKTLGIIDELESAITRLNSQFIHGAKNVQQLS
jgi:hypothetical protein